MSRAMMSVSVLALVFLVATCVDGFTQMDVLLARGMKCVPAYTACVEDDVLTPGGFLTMNADEFNDFFFLPDLGGPQSSLFRKLQTKRRNVYVSERSVWVNTVVKSDTGASLDANLFEAPVAGQHSWAVPLPYLYLQWTTAKRPAEDPQYTDFDPKKATDQFLDPYCRVQCVRTSDPMAAPLAGQNAREELSTLALAQHPRLGHASPANFATSDALELVAQALQPIQFTCRAATTPQDCPNKYLRPPRAVTIKVVYPKRRAPVGTTFMFYFCTPNAAAHRIGQRHTERVPLLLVPVSSQQYSPIAPDYTDFALPQATPMRLF